MTYSSVLTGSCPIILRNPRTVVLDSPKLSFVFVFDYLNRMFGLRKCMLLRYGNFKIYFNKRNQGSEICFSQELERVCKGC